MGLATYSYGKEINKKKDMPHPGPWNTKGTDDGYEVVENTVLQVTDAVKNNNKFYAVEIHKHQSGSFRLFTHYGRTDDLDTKGDSAGTKECRYGGETDVRAEASRILKQKQNPKKGYKQVHLAKSKIGSPKARGSSAGHVDQATLNAQSKNQSASKKVAAKKAPRAKKTSLSAEVERIVRQFYHESGAALTKRANVSITADGFETPMGVLTLAQVRTGFDCIDACRTAVASGSDTKIKRATSDYFTAIPHKIGRTKKNMAAAIIDHEDKVVEEEELLQMMKDMLEVNDSTGTNLFAKSELDLQYEALNSTIDFVDPSDRVWKRLKTYMNESESRHHHVSLQVKNIYKMARKGEKQRFQEGMGNVRELFHGTRSANMVGILSRGLMLPRQAAAGGAVITGAMFGPGLYFADASTKSSQYCGQFNGANKGHNSFMFVTGVALGKMKEYEMAQTQLRAAPRGYNSVAGVTSSRGGTRNYLLHNEYIIFELNQQELRYIVEFETVRKRSW